MKFCVTYEIEGNTVQANFERFNDANDFAKMRKGSNIVRVTFESGGEFTPEGYYVGAAIEVPIE